MIAAFVVEAEGVLMEPRQRIARRLRELRVAAGMTQAQLARATGIPARSLGNWEQAAADIPLVRAIEIAAALGVPLAALLEEPASGDGPLPGPGRPPRKPR